MQTQRIKLADLAPNNGQIPGLPSNPRQWTRTEVDKIAKSLKETPELFDARPIIVTPYGGKYIILGGNLRYEGCKANKDKDAPCIIIPEGTTVEKMKEIVLKDNGAFGQWDYDALANEWDDLPLVDWCVPAWDTSSPDMNLSTKGREGDEDYDSFVDKFKQKLTTDDCYTPPEVFDVVRDFVDKNVTKLNGKKIVRPFYPGGNYENLEQYPKGSIVIDNPPFSILSAIIRFYCGHEIPFFIFAPSLTLFSAHDCDVTYIVSNAPVVYENGAVVSTGFITNLIPDLRIWCCPQIREEIIASQETEDKTKQGFVYPDNIVTSAVLGKLVAHATELKVRKISCEYIKSSDSAEEQGRSLYGGGYILSDGAAAERAAAERAAATRLNISDRERSIIERLNRMEMESTPGEKCPQT